MHGLFLFGITIFSVAKQDRQAGAKSSSQGSALLNLIVGFDADDISGLLYAMKIEYPLTSCVMLHTNQVFVFVIVLPRLEDFGLECVF